MIDHVGFPVSDYVTSKLFYERALAPLGYDLIMEVGENEMGAPAAGFGIGGNPDFWIGGEGGVGNPVHVAITARDRAAVDAFHREAVAGGGKDNGAHRKFSTLRLGEGCCSTRRYPSPIFLC